MSLGTSSTSLPAADGAGAFLSALRAGEERAFLALVDRHHGCMLKLARALLPAHAEDVVRDAWRRFLASCGALPDGAALEACVFGAVVASTRDRARQDGVALELATSPEPSVAPERFQPNGERYGDNWARPPAAWDAARVAGDAVARALARAVDRLPSGERAAHLLRDSAGLGGPHVCGLLGLSECEVRALVHRARSKLRAAVEAELAGGRGAA